MNWKFWERKEIVVLAADSKATVGSVLESMTDEQLMFCYYTSNKEWEDILQTVIKSRLRKAND